MRTITIEAPAAKIASTQRKPGRFDRFWRQKKVIVPVIVAVCLTVGLGVYGWLTVRAIQAKAQPVMASVDTLKTAAKAQNLSTIQQELPVLQQRLASLEQEVDSLAYLQYLPLLGSYYEDGQRMFSAAQSGLTGGQVLVDAMLPYAHILGFSTDQPDQENTLSSEEKIAELVLLMPALLPSIDEASQHMTKARQQIDAIDVSKYPETIQGRSVRSQLQEVQQQIDQLEEGMRMSQPLLRILPSVMGADSTKRYLLLFQNDKELRPTGGFLSSYAYITFQHGKFTVSENGDIYTLDRNRAYLPIPAPMRTYLAVPQLNMRDTNFSPDFVTSMEDFELYYDRGGNTPVDGILAVDTQFVEDLMRITGPLSVPGYSQPFSAEVINVNGTEVPQVVYQLELISEKLATGADRKGILGDLMQVMIQHVMNEPLPRWSEYAQVLMKGGQEKHVLLYFHDQQAQQLAEEWNFAGRIKPVETGTDYLHISDANLGGLKSNFYLKQDVTNEVRVDADGTVHRKLTITYRNTGKFDGWLNATARNYTRVYVPLGAQLVASSGGEQRVTVQEDLGYTVFDNFVRIPSLQTKTMTFEYTLPFTITDNQYQSLIQKQPGANNWQYTNIINGQEHQLVLDGDKELSIGW